jgi:hypothetical protein
VAAAGDDPNSAVKLMIADKLPELTKIQVEAVKNLKIDKITVWDNMSGGKVVIHLPLQSFYPECLDQFLLMKSSLKWPEWNCPTTSRKNKT